MTAREGTLEELKFDSHNANLGTEFGTHLLRKSIEELGVGRGIVAAADKTIIGGNHVTQMLVELGFEKVIYVPTDGKTLVVNQRMDIQPGTKAFHELAIADNKVQEANLLFDPLIVDSLAASLDIDVESWGFVAPLDANEAKAEKEVDTQATTHTCPNCKYEW